MKISWKKYRAIIVAWCMTAALLLTPVNVMAAAGSGTDAKDLRSMEGWPAGPEVVGESAFLLEANSGMVLYGKNEEITRFPASITKVVTSLVVLEHCDNLQAEVTFSHNAVTDIEDGGHNWNFVEGEVLTVEQCLYAFLLESVNECGYALAEYIAGDIPSFAALMNEKAAELGCVNTHFNNPHGLNDDNHTTCAKDMGLLFWAALQNDEFYKICSTTAYTIPAVEGKTAGHQLTMHHKMMLPESEYYYDGVKAGKTGYTSIAKNTLLTYAERDGMELICVVMKSEGGGVIYNDTAKLLNYGFNNFRYKNMNTISQNFARGLNAVYPMPLAVEGISSVVLPDGVEALTMDFVRDTTGIPGAVGEMQFRNGSDVLASNPIRILNGAEAEAVVKNTALGTAAAESQPEGTAESDNPQAVAEKTTDPAANDAGGQNAGTQTEKKGHSLFFWFFMVLLFLVLGVAAYWAVIQIIKRRRRRKKLERRRQMRQQGRYQR